jgi:hypothetical protein
MIIPEIIVCATPEVAVKIQILKKNAFMAQYFTDFEVKIDQADNFSAKDALACCLIWMDCGNGKLKFRLRRAKKT